MLNGEIILNCNTIGKIISKVSNKNNSRNVYELIHDLKSASRDFDNYELKNNVYVKMENGGIITEKETKIRTPHYYYKEKNHIIHGTSNIKTNLDISQIAEVPINSLILNGAKNPGTIINKNAKIWFVTSKHVLVPIYEINAIKFQNSEFFDLDNKDYNYMKNKNLIYTDIMLKNSIDVDNIFIKELTTNCYTEALSSATSDTILDEIRNRNDSLD